MTYRNYLNATPMSTNAVRFKLQDEPQGAPSQPPSQSLSGEPVAAGAGAGNAVRLRWTLPAGFKTFGIAIARRDVTTGEELLQRHAELSDPTATGYVDTAVETGHEYEYLVIFDLEETDSTKFVDGIRRQLTTNVIRADLASLLPPPTNLRGEDVTHKALTLRWDAPAGVDGVDVVGYQIYRRGPGDGELSLLVEDTGSAETEYRDYVLAGRKRLRLQRQGDCRGVAGGGILTRTGCSARRPRKRASPRSGSFSPLHPSLRRIYSQLRHTDRRLGGLLGALLRCAPAGRFQSLSSK